MDSLVFTKLFILLALGASVASQERGKGSNPCVFPAIYNFGDSNSDTGGISAAFLPIPDPNGQDFFHKPAGRVGDGRLIVDFIAEHLGLPYLSAYLDSLDANFRHGANFATGGSTIRRQNETIFENGISPFSLDIQTVHFDQFQLRSNDLYNQAKTESSRSRLPRPIDFSRALYTFDIGQDDITHGLRKLGAQQLRTTLPDIVNQLATAVTHLYHRGARTFWIHNTGPIGCLPVHSFYIRNPKPGFLDQFGCIRGHNDMAIEFNRQLKDRVTTLRAELPLAAITYVDIYTAKYNLISSTKVQGFMDPLKICCGRHEGNVHVWCGQRTIINGTEVFGGACAAPSAHVSWDGMHYTQAANHWTSNQILTGSMTDPPISISQACHRHAPL
ncbi:putative alpha-L-fucosidase [Heracleum sosnowskyi]|uniref:Alpha-L-fucosidase n=1 Tax=Heracleum sosnowskyi TaxID=360622 RepID=A0AAD8H4H7_9APIA|nr:putative alpha-L-fucosidase [Heracleum sosnowskyi]